MWRRKALAIALYSVLATPTFKEAVILAVNHSGDSDSTGAIAGNLAGTLYGAEAIPDRWTTTAELHDEILVVADDLFALQAGTLDLESESTWVRYPGSQVSRPQRLRRGSISGSVRNFV